MGCASSKAGGAVATPAPISVASSLTLTEAPQRAESVAISAEPEVAVKEATAQEASEVVAPSAAVVSVQQAPAAQEQHAAPDVCAPVSEPPQPHVEPESRPELSKGDIAQQQYMAMIQKKRAKTFSVEVARSIVLHNAVLNGSIQAAQTALDLGATVNDRDCLRNSALHLAAAHGDEAMVHWLLEKGARINVANRAGWSPLHYAVLGGQAAIAEALLRRSAWANFHDNKLTTPLHVVCTRAGDFATLQRLICLLLDYGGPAGLEQLDDKGQTPLHVAATCGNVAAVRILLARNASAKDFFFRPLSEAAQRQRVPKAVQIEINALLAASRNTPGGFEESTARSVLPPQPPQLSQQQHQQHQQLQQQRQQQQQQQQQQQAQQLQQQQQAVTVQS
eukprot:7214-Heterococcus_DN1.PRE.4